MKFLEKIYNLALGRLLKLELSTDGGKLNLAGGVLAFLLLIAIIVLQSASLWNFILILCNRDKMLPELSVLQFGYLLGFLIVYFIVCIKIMPRTEKKI